MWWAAIATHSLSLQSVKSSFVSMTFNQSPSPWDRRSGQKSMNLQPDEPFYLPLEVVTLRLVVTLVGLKHLHHLCHSFHNFSLPPHYSSKGSEAATVDPPAEAVVGVEVQPRSPPAACCSNEGLVPFQFRCPSPPRHLMAERCPPEAVGRLGLAKAMNGGRCRCR